MIADNSLANLYELKVHDVATWIGKSTMRPLVSQIATHEFAGAV